VTVRLGPGRLTLDHRILTTRPGEEFRWCDLGWFTRLAYGERARFLSPSGGGTRYRVELSITGVASRLVGVTLGRDLTAKMRAETLALKQRAEALRQQPSRQSAP
jgi:hypothetical protein